MARCAIGVLVVFIAITGVGMALASAMTAMRAHTLVDAVSRYEAITAVPARQKRLQKLVSDLDGAGPALGLDAAAYWDTASLIYMTALTERPAQDETWLSLADQAETTARKSLTIRPFHHGPWSRLAALDFARDGALDSEGRHALAMARRSAPYRSELALWRAEFALAVWSQLDEPLRENALADATFLLTSGQYDDRRRLQERLTSAPADVQAQVAAHLAQQPSL